MVIRAVKSFWVHQLAPYKSILLIPASSCEFNSSNDLILSSVPQYRITNNFVIEHKWESDDNEALVGAVKIIVLELKVKTYSVKQLNLVNSKNWLLEILDLLFIFYKLCLELNLRQKYSSYLYQMILFSVELAIYRMIYNNNDCL